MCAKSSASVSSSTTPSDLRRKTGKRRRGSEAAKLGGPAAILFVYGVFFFVFVVVLCFLAVFCFLAFLRGVWCFRVVHWHFWMEFGLFGFFLSSRTTHELGGADSQMVDAMSFLSRCDEPCKVFAL